MTLIVRHKYNALAFRDNPGGPRTTYGTLSDDSALVAKFKEVHRDTGQRIGGMRVVEHDRWDKSTIRVKLSQFLNSRGDSKLMPSHWAIFRLLDRHQHIRKLTAPDEFAIGGLDIQITAKLEELRELREQRKAAVAAAWTRATKVDIDALEEATTRKEPRNA